MHITRHLRASVIDWLFEVAMKLSIEDKSVVFQAVNLMDRYYNQLTESPQTRDLQLTAVTALFIASKNLEVDPLDLQTCLKTLCFNKYSRKQFLKKEEAIRRATNYENEAPTVLDFLMFYLRSTKLAIQKQVDCGAELQNFLQSVQTIAYDLTKSVIIDASLNKYKPSVIALSLVALGF